LSRNGAADTALQTVAGNSPSTSCCRTRPAFFDAYRPASFAGPREQPRDLDARTQDFQARTGRTPADFAAAWREGKIEDTPQNAREAIEAPALREAMQSTAAVGWP